MRESQEVVAKSDNVAAPAYLTPTQKKEFKRISDELKEIGIMSNLDCGTLAMYLRMLDRYKTLDKKLQELDSLEDTDVLTYEKLFKLWDRSISQCQSLAKSMGMTIDSRCKLVVPKKEEKPKQNKFMWDGTNG